MLGVRLAIVMIGTGLAAVAQAAGPVSCERLRSVQLSQLTITNSEAVAPGAFKPPAPEMGMGPPADHSRLPPFCRVQGSIHPTADSDIRFELWLPITGWNGRFMQTGNGGAAGSIVYSSLVEPLSRGYAVANTDTGHQGAGGDFAWAANHPEKLKDLAYRAVHELTVTGKALTTAHYGKAPEKAYWYGCSTGGRQGLKEAQLYPDDYDAIIAGAPASNWAALMGLSVVIQRNLTQPDGLSPSKLPLLHAAALAACDAQDGVKDQVIGDTRQCSFDPASLLCKAGQHTQCLSASEVAAAQRIYRGVVTQSGKRLFPGTGPGSEMLWAAYASPQFSIGSSYFRNVVVHDPNWSPASFDVDTDVKQAEQGTSGAMVAMNPDLSRFIAHGGKLLTYHGTADGLISFGNSVNYYRSVVAKIGADAANSSVRLFLVPGMSHCSGGEGAYVVDWLGAAEGWVEHSTAPSVLPALHPANPNPGASQDKAFTRPVCAYPKVARYKGSGDVREATSFTCEN